MTAATDGFVIFDEKWFYSDNDCDANMDIAGVGVIVSYGVIAVLTMLCSLHAASMDIKNDSPNALLPKLVRRYVCRIIRPAKLPKEEYNFRRTQLDSLLLELAGQQIFTSIALIVSGYVETVRKMSEYHHMRFPAGGVARTANFHLIVYLSCLARSAAFGAMINVQDPFRGNPIAYIIRRLLLLFFSIIILISIFSSQAFPFLFSLFDASDFHDINGKEREKTAEETTGFAGYSRSASKITHATVLLIFLMLSEFLSFCLCVCNPLSSTKPNNRFWNKTTWFSSVTTWCFYSVFNRTVAFGIQMSYFIVSAVFVIAQKIRKDPTGYHCDLSANSEWGYGQTLAIFVLGQLLFSVWQVYVEMKKGKEFKTNLPYLEELDEDEQGIIRNTARGSEHLCEQGLADAESNTEGEFGSLRRRATS